MPTRHQARFCRMTRSTHHPQTASAKLPHLPFSHLRQQAKTDEEEEKLCVTQWRGADAAWATTWFSLLIHQCGTLMSRRRSAQGSPHKCAAVWCGYYTEGIWVITVCREVVKIVLHTETLSLNPEHLFHVQKKRKHELSAVNGCIRREIFITDGDERLTLSALPYLGLEETRPPHREIAGAVDVTAQVQGTAYEAGHKTGRLLVLPDMYLIFSLQNKAAYCSILFYLKNNLNVSEQLRTCWSVIFFFFFNFI